MSDAEPRPKRTLKPTKKRGPKKPRKRRAPGRPKAVDTVVVRPLEGGKRLRFVLSDDVVQRLIAAHDRLYRSIVPPYMLKERDKYLRILFVRFVDLSIPAVLMRIEEPSFDPRGNKLRRAVNGHQWLVEVSARRVGLRSDVPPQVVQFYETEDITLRGVVVNFADECMVHPGDKADFRKVFSLPADPDDLRA